MVIIKATRKAMGIVLIILMVMTVIPFPALANARTYATDTTPIVALNSPPESDEDGLWDCIGCVACVIGVVGGSIVTSPAAVWVFLAENPEVVAACAIECILCVGTIICSLLENPKDYELCDIIMEY